MTEEYRPPDEATTAQPEPAQPEPAQPEPAQPEPAEPEPPGDPPVAAEDPAAQDEAATAAGDVPEAAAPSEPPEPPEPPRRIWDPAARAWVTEDEIAAAPPAHRPAGARPYEPALPALEVARPPEAAPATGLPRSLAALVAGATGAVLAVVAMLFVPGVVDRRAPQNRPRIIEGSGTVPASDMSAQVKLARPWVVTVVAGGATQSVLGARDFRRAGSGVVMSDDGAIATPARLVDGADKISVTTSSGITAEAKLIGSDKITDVAIVRVDVADLPPAVLGTTEVLELGHPVVAVSAQSGLQAVVATGAISAMGRTVDPGDGELMLDMLLVDAALGSTGSGGALVAGEALVGMTASFGEGSFGYATPIDVVRSVSEQILAGKDVKHPWVGLTVDKAEGRAADGLVVATVFKDGPAEKAAMKMGDLIVAIDGSEVRGALSLLRRLLESEIGTEITLDVQRAEGTQEVKLTVGERPSLR